jgi:hypothetical protein
VSERRRAVAWGLDVTCLRALLAQEADRSAAVGESRPPREQSAGAFALCCAVLSRLPDSFLRFEHARRSEGTKERRSKLGWEAAHRPAARSASESIDQYARDAARESRLPESGHSALGGRC